MVDDDVVWLDVAVRYAAAMQVAHGVGYLHDRSMERVWGRV